jgi:hypothetical protein
MPTKSKKYVLGASIDADRYSAFHAIAQDRNLSKSRLLGLLINDFLRKAPIIEPASTDPNQKKTEDLRIRLSPFQYAELRRLAAACHWHPGTYLRHLFNVHLTGKPQFTDAELHALYQVTEQIADMGRNVSQIARALNTSLDNAHLAMAVPFDKMHMLLELEKSFINNLASGSLARGGDDGK